MRQSSVLRERAARCRRLACDYLAEVARPLVEKAEALEREAARIDNHAYDRPGREPSWSGAGRPRRVFGRAEPRRVVIQADAGILFPLWEPPRI